MEVVGSEGLDLSKGVAQGWLDVVCYPRTRAGMYNLCRLSRYPKFTWDVRYTSRA